MKKFSTVYKFHLKENLTSKAFKISTAIIFVAILAFLGYSNWANSSDSGNKDKISLINETSNEVSIQALNKTLEETKLNEAGQSQGKSLRKKVEQGDLDGVLIVKDQKGVPGLTYIYKNFPNNEVVPVISQALQQAYISNTITKNKINAETASSLLATVQVKDEVLKDTSNTFGIVYLFVFFMYIFIMGFGQMIATAIAAEKSSRVMEIMIPKVKPIMMMYAKIAAILTGAIVQIAFIGVAGGIAYLAGWLDADQLSIFGAAIDLSNLTPGVITAFIAYFVLGYLLYAMLYAAVGSMVSRTEDLGSSQFPIIILIMGAFFIGMRSLFDPSTTLVVVSSYIPFFSPIVTFSRIVAGEAGAMEISITIGILLVSLWIINRIAGRIYVHGVMHYGGKVKLKDMIQVAKNS
ncbi:ABC transporter permease [Fictibacillus sp. KIGAM418]|uniref:ABC transporter permease n=1 Tax=Fictibacillus marinisediminis TaxID=2878389 RepID=A0A9X2BEG3_9BACL|nr:ABC transporter permease [Fictibacillus marinisediminis]MCK6256062.1 ABC transporter permease [Fictibacillus marinisediminis]